MVRAVCSFLREREYEIDRVVESNQERGHDIIATSKTSRARIFVECKGETSSREGSGRYGSKFDAGQRTDHVGKALVKALQVLSNQSVTNQAGIGLPLNHQSLIDTMSGALQKTGIVVFLVSPDKKVTVYLGTLLK